MLLDLIAGARPNFVKLAPIIRAVEAAKAAEKNIDYRFIHTGQHSSDAMSGAILRDLAMPSPHIHLNATGETRGAMLASVIAGYDAVLRGQRPAWTVVVGDVTSTLGAALAAKSADVLVAHVEAGLRSGDRTMPEEMNRIATDAVADIHFTTSHSAGAHLLREGVAGRRIHFVGNTMVDAMLQALPTLTRPEIFSRLRLAQDDFVLLTLHRPANVDDGTTLHEWLAAVSDASAATRVVFPVHPRTAARFKARLPDNITLIEPVSYAASLYLQQAASLIITDSGGVSEETTILRKPCVTLRGSTERPETVSIGTNVLCHAPGSLPTAVSAARIKARKVSAIPELWDGNSSKRIVNALLDQ